MNKKIFSRISAAVMAAAIMAGQAIVACAYGDVQLDCTNAIESDNWTQSIQFNYNNDDPDDLKSFDATRMTDQSVITVTYDILETYRPFRYSKGRKRHHLRNKTKEGAGLLSPHDSSQLWWPLCPDGY